MEERCYPSVDDELVGFDDDADILIQKLIRGPKELDIISIVGAAGQGKTALAEQVYNDPSVAGHFSVHAWCSISDSYNVRMLLLEILKNVMGDKHVNVDDHSIVDMLHKNLQTKRFLVVLDNLLEVKGWEDLRLFFRDVVNGSRIMLTTRVVEVANKLKLHSEPYLLPRLTDDESWKLLQKKVFQEERCPSELDYVGPIVAKKCMGLPFQIIMIAGIISKNKRRDSDFWFEVAKNISSLTPEEESLKMIGSSYNRLEDHLKSCLMYMGLFPKGYEIPVSDLLKWWIAEEFVQNTDRLELEETARICLSDLVSRNLVMVSKRGINGEMKYCKVRDQVHEFCLRKIKEDKFMQPVVRYNPYKPLDADKKRLCMYIHDTMKSDSKERECFGHSGRSMEFIAHPKFSISNRKNPFPLLNNMSRIRVLHLLDIYLENSWAAAFQSLTHLRYLAMFVKVFDFEWVSELLHLQTLRVRSSYTMISAAIWKMEKLRHVDINEFSVTCEKDERVNFAESSDIVLDNMKTLGTCYMSVADMTPNFWGKFPNLEELRLHIDEFGDIPNDLDGSYSSYFSFPSSLKALSLSDSFLTEEIVSSIAKLLHLETLKLSEIYFTGEKQWNLNKNVFHALKVLKLHHVFMTQWYFSDESFPILEKLVLKSCSKLEKIPDSLVDIPTIQLIKVIDCRDSVGVSALEIKEEVEAITGDDSLKVHISDKD